MYTYFVFKTFARRGKGSIISSKERAGLTFRKPVVNSNMEGEKGIMGKGEREGVVAAETRRWEAGGRWKRQVIVPGLVHHG